MEFARKALAVILRQKPEEPADPRTVPNANWNNRPKLLFNNKGYTLPPQPKSTIVEFLSKFYILPESKFLFCWERFIIFVLYINGILVVFMTAYQHYTVPALATTYVLDMFCLLDMFFKFHIAFLHSGFWVTFPKEMALNYIYSWEFKLDLSSNLPLEIFSPLGGAAFWYTFLVLRSNRCIRTIRVFVWFYRQEKKLYSAIWMQAVKFFCFITPIMHTFACVWFTIACPPHLATENFCEPHSWIVKVHLMQPMKNLKSVYVHSIYWTVTTMTSTGYGDITPGQDEERIFAAISMITGLFLFGYVSGTIASALSNLDSRRVLYRQKIDAVLHFMKDRKMDGEFQQRVLEWYDYAWERNKGILINNLFDDMPVAFKSEVAMHLNQDIVNKSSIFAKTSSAFRRFIAMSLKFYLFTAQEYVYRKNDACNEMYFLVRGRIDIYLEETDQKAESSLVDGSILADVNLIFATRHANFAMAVSNTDIYALKRSDLERALVLFPEEKDLVMAAVEERKSQIEAIEQRKMRARRISRVDDDFIDNNSNHGGSGKNGGHPYVLSSEKEKESTPVQELQRMDSHGGFMVLEKTNPGAPTLLANLREVRKQQKGFLNSMASIGSGHVQSQRRPSFQRSTTAISITKINTFDGPSEVEIKIEKTATQKSMKFEYKSQSNMFSGSDK